LAGDAVNVETRRVAAIVVEDDFEGSLSQRVVGVVDAMDSLRTAGYVLVLIHPDEVVVRRREEDGRRRWWRRAKEK
jgi:hypothetical protein